MLILESVQTDGKGAGEGRAWTAELSVSCDRRDL